MVIGYHLVWTLYGWWLPNDPRGSMSHTIASDPIAELGEPHYGRKKVQPASAMIHEFYERAGLALRFPLLTAGTAEATIIADAFAQVIRNHGYTCYACAIMLDHVHALIRKHREKAEEMIAALQAGSRTALIAAGLRGADHPVWGGPGWKVYQDDPQTMRRTIRYIEDNPVKARMPPQAWSFVTPYDGWPFHKRQG